MGQGDAPPLLSFVTALAFTAAMVIGFGYLLGVGLRLAGVCG